eukprot:5042107-Pleurochrysis_carterae.AAC.2
MASPRLLLQQLPTGQFRQAASEWRHQTVGLRQTDSFTRKTRCRNDVIRECGARDLDAGDVLPTRVVGRVERAPVGGGAHAVPAARKHTRAHTQARDADLHTTIGSEAGGDGAHRSDETRRNRSTRCRKIGKMTRGALKLTSAQHLTRNAADAVTKCMRTNRPEDTTSWQAEREKAKVATKWSGVSSGVGVVSRGRKGGKNSVCKKAAARGRFARGEVAREGAAKEGAAGTGSAREGAASKRLMTDERGYLEARARGERRR